MSNRYTATAALLVGAALLAGCQHQESKSGDKIAKPSPTPSPTPSADLTLRLPDGMPELGLSAEVAPTRGSQQVAVIDVTKPTMWVNLNCIGEGQLWVDIGTNRMGIPCHAGRILPTRNQMATLAMPKRIALKVEAPDAVQWSLRVQQ